ncbi:MAG: anti-sigma factor [Sphingomonas sp.]|nr:anti-sigma factor [Sphingomonas sp.]
MIEEEKFFAWLDGELTPDESARVEAEVAADPELSGLADEHRAMTSGLRGAFDTVERQPVPEKLERAARGQGDSRVVDIGEARAARERRNQPLWVQAAAIAATLAVGVFTGNQLSGGMFGGNASSPIAAQGGHLVASADLDDALSARLASAPAGNGPRIGLTFREKSGAVCRTFEDNAASGLACRENGDWRIRTILQSTEGGQSDYRMASGGDPRLMDAVERAIAGDPFDAAQEKAAMAKGWE